MRDAARECGCVGKSPERLPGSFSKFWKTRLELLTGPEFGGFSSMAQHQEIERKFLVKQPPAGWRRHKSARIVQGYFPTTTKEVEIRLRHVGASYFITVK